ncbi:MAG: tetraacyldisaccharide 4'-kinase [Candidatus Pelagibacter sp.]
MNFKKPLFWNLKEPNFFSYLLIPFTIPFMINNFLLKIKKKNKFSKIKSICIGNIYLGGTGKTPLTIKLYEIIKKMDFNVITAKKFYPYQVDEQTLLKNKTQTIITKKRLDAINKAINNAKDVIIFDDGLQERNIDYDLKIVCFKKNNWIGNGQLIPSGPLREKVESLKNYDVVFLNGKNNSSVNIEETILKINSKIRIFNSNYEIKNLDKLDKNSNYLIFSGIGDPSSFKEILIENNINVIKEKIFTDHYIYKKEDVKNIIEEAKKVNAKILTTEKDFVKLSDDVTGEIDYLKIELKIEEEQKFINFLNDKLN